MMHASVRVSAIIPTQNRPAFLREALASVCAQTYRNVEIVVVDDGSAPAARAATQRVITEFARGQDLPVRCIVQPHRGVSAARNRGVRASRGALLAFLDSDDVWLPDKLARQVALFDAQPRTRICQTEEIWLRRGVRVNPRAVHRKPDGDVFFASLARCVVSPSAVMLRRALFERVGGFDEALPACEDYDLWLRIAVNEPVPLIDVPLVLKRGGHDDQLSRRYWGMDRFRIVALRKLLDSGWLSDPRRWATLDMLHAKCRILAQGARKRGKSAAAYEDIVSRYSHGDAVSSEAAPAAEPYAETRLESSAA